MADKIEVNDKLVRIIGIQLFGIVIPNATGLVDNADRSVTFLMLTYAFFILIAFSIWQGNRYLLFKLQERVDWFNYPGQKVVMLLTMNIFYTAPLTVGMLLIWYYLAGKPADWEVIKITAIVCVVCVVFVTHVYETVFLIKQRESDKIKGEQLERAKVQAELEALKNQIDPHFMFNSLNSLSYLIDENPEKAKEFTESLAEVYRYILSNKDQKLVLLEDEISFLKKYISLLKLRFDRALKVNFHLPTAEQADFLIPPISIFIAVENVVKHNEISRKTPLSVDINQEGNGLTVSNRIIRKKNVKHSSKIGLKNLDERFKILTGQGIDASPVDGYFKLHMPLLKLNG
ncbi:MAG: histidine kinase [Bacteroidota bacterium]